MSPYREPQAKAKEPACLHAWILVGYGESELPVWVCEKCRMEPLPMQAFLLELGMLSRGGG